MIGYLAVKHVHMTCAAASGSFFALRGIWMLRDSTLLPQRWVKIAPHIIDTVLLGSALTMVVWSGQYPFVQPWLTTKLLALLLYIVLGTVTVHPARTLHGQVMRRNADRRQ